MRHSGGVMLPGECQPSMKGGRLVGEELLATASVELQSAVVTASVELLHAMNRHEHLLNVRHEYLPLDNHTLTHNGLTDNNTLTDNALRSKRRHRRNSSQGEGN